MRFNLLEPVMFFDADKGGGSGAPAPTGESAAANTPTGGGTTPGNSSPAGTQPAGSQPPPTIVEEIKLTPAQLSERLERARASLLKQFGFDDPETLKKALQDGKTALDAQKTEAERQAEALKQAQERSQTLESQVSQAQAQAEQAALQVEALGLMSGRFANPKTALKLLNLEGIKKAENGSYTGLKEAIEKLATDEPWTLAKPATRPVAPPIGSTNPEGDGKKVITDEERRQRYFGSYGAGHEFFTPKTQEPGTKTG
jgi:hypothetical protein